MATHGKPTPIYIAIFGGPRAGKSSFIRDIFTKNAPRQNLPPTSDVRLMKPLAIDGRQVVLVDTPAFYNRAIRNLDSADVLKRLAAFLLKLQKSGRQLSAAIFVYPKVDRPNAPWLLEDSQRNWPIFCKLVGDAFFPNVIFATTGWPSSPTADQLAQESKIRAQEPFRSHIQRVNWGSGPSAQSALEIVRIAIKCSPRPLAIQHELAQRRLRLADTSVGREVTEGAKQLAQQLRARGNVQAAQTAEKVGERIRARQGRPNVPPSRGQGTGRPPRGNAQGRPVRQTGPAPVQPMSHRPGRGGKQQPTAHQPMRPKPPGAQPRPTVINTAHHHMHDSSRIMLATGAVFVGALPLIYDFGDYPEDGEGPYISDDIPSDDDSDVNVLKDINPDKDFEKSDAEDSDNGAGESSDEHGSPVTNSPSGYGEPANNSQEDVSRPLSSEVKADTMQGGNIGSGGNRADGGDDSGGCCDCDNCCECDNCFKCDGCCECDNCCDCGWFSWCCCCCGDDDDNRRS